MEKETTKEIKKSDSNIVRILQNIQQELKAPKEQRNDFGKYNYRSCEDILLAVKPLLAKNNCVIVLTDSIIEVGGRNYVEATAILSSGTLGSFQVKAFAREADTKKGMDEAQITGSASSYARKYALNGMFAIDDNKDADMTEVDKKEIIEMEKHEAEIGMIDDIKTLKEYYEKNKGLGKDFNALVMKRKYQIEPKDESK